MDWIQLISQLGFPIVSCIACAFVIYKTMLAEREENKEREAKMFDTIREISKNIAELGQVVKDCTEAISVMNERISKLEDKIDDDDK